MAGVTPDHSAEAAKTTWWFGTAPEAICAANCFTFSEPVVSSAFRQSRRTKEQPGKDKQNSGTGRPLTSYGRSVRQARILGRLRDGLAHSDIARIEGLSTRRVREIVADALKRRPLSDRETHLRLQIERLTPPFRRLRWPSTRATPKRSGRSSRSSTTSTGIMRWRQLRSGASRPTGLTRSRGRGTRNFSGRRTHNPMKTHDRPRETADNGGQCGIILGDRRGPFPACVGQRRRSCRAGGSSDRREDSVATRRLGSRGLAQRRSQSLGIVCARNIVRTLGASPLRLWSDRRQGLFAMATRLISPYEEARRDLPNT